MKGTLHLKNETPAARTAGASKETDNVSNPKPVGNIIFPATEYAIAWLEAVYLVRPAIASTVAEHARIGGAQ